MAQRPGLETVTEEGEEDAVGKDRDENGQTELHKLAAQQGKLTTENTSREITLHITLCRSVKWVINKQFIID